MDLNKLIARVKGILLAPKSEWPTIAQEPATAADLYKNYILVLAAIPAVFTFLQMSVIGTNVMFAGRVRSGIGTGLGSMVVSYVLTLASVYIMAIIIEALAPTFGGEKNRIQALKTVAYAYTASWIAGVGYILPGLGLLVALAGGVYSIYLLYLGLPQTMKCPQEKAAGYTAVSIIIAIVLSLIVGALVAGVSGIGSFSGGGSSYSVSDDDVQFDEDGALGKLEQWGKQVEEAGKKLEAAEESGDLNAQSEALKQMMGAALGGGQVEALPPDRLKQFVPKSLAGLERSQLSTRRNDAMGIQISEATATYSDDSGRSVNLEITDTGTAKGLFALAGWSGVEGETETAQGYEKTYRKDGRLVHEKWNSDGYGEYALVLGDRFTVKIDGQADSVDDLKKAVGELDLRGLEALKDEGVVAD